MRSVPLISLTTVVLGLLLHVHAAAAQTCGAAGVYDVFSAPTSCTGVRGCLEDLCACADTNSNTTRSDVAQCLSAGSGTTATCASAGSCIESVVQCFDAAARRIAGAADAQTTTACRTWSNQFLAVFNATNRATYNTSTLRANCDAATCTLTSRLGAPSTCSFGSGGLAATCVNDYCTSSAQCGALTDFCSMPAGRCRGCWPSGSGPTALATASTITMNAEGDTSTLSAAACARDRGHFDVSPCPAACCGWTEVNLTLPHLVVNVGSCTRVATTRYRVFYRVGTNASNATAAEVPGIATECTVTHSTNAAVPAAVANCTGIVQLGTCATKDVQVFVLEVVANGAPRYYATAPGPLTIALTTQRDTCGLAAAGGAIVIIIVVVAAVVVIGVVVACLCCCCRSSKPAAAPPADHPATIVVECGPRGSTTSA